MSGNYPFSGETNPAKLVRSIRDLFEGRSNAMGTFSITKDVTTTTVTAPNVGPQSRIFLMPTTAHAAAEVAAGGLYISAVAVGQFTVTHANDTSEDRTFYYAIVG